MSVGSVIALIKALGGGGGGGSSGGALVIEATTQDGTNFTADITLGELYEAALTGPVIIYATFTSNNGVSDAESGFAMPLVDAIHYDTGINVVYDFFFGFNGVEATGEATDTVQFQLI